MDGVIECFCNHLSWVELCFARKIRAIKYKSFCWSINIIHKTTSRFEIKTCVSADGKTRINFMRNCTSFFKHVLSSNNTWKLKSFLSLSSIASRQTTIRKCLIDRTTTQKLDRWFGCHCFIVCQHNCFLFGNFFLYFLIHHL